MQFIYNVIIYLYRLAVIIASPFNRKAALWCQGRKGFFRKWEDFDAGNRKVVWFHCASLGEFEQGRPVIEEMKRRDNDLFILLTFFSPSGYEIRKDYPLADAVCYLPDDTPRNSRKFLDVFKPAMALFVKYEFWYNYISALERNKIPVYLISANFRADQLFFRWYGRWFRKMLHMYSHLFVQSESSQELLRSAGIATVSVSGDTRFDRVYQLASSNVEIPLAASFTGSKFTIVAGSTWPADNSLWIRYMNETSHDIKLIIAPHEINEDQVSQLTGSFTVPAARFSRSDSENVKGARVLIIDNIGMLSSLYNYGGLAYVGGGFGKGIHNILEACTHGLPVIFGPNYKKFREATELVNLGAAFPIDNYDDFAGRINNLFVNNDLLIKAGRIAADYVKSGTGASNIIVDKLLIS